MWRTSVPVICSLVFLVAPSVVRVSGQTVSGMPGRVPPSTQPPQATYPIDLDASLRLAAVENPRIAEARVAILEALARQKLAQAILVPTLNAGMNYHGHDGNLQRSSGRILKLSEQSLYVGGGARTLAAEALAIPAVNIDAPLTNAIFEPLAARQRVEATRFEARATANDTLLDVAVLYQELSGSVAVYDALVRSLLQVDEIVRLTRNFADAGQGRDADADRALTEHNLLTSELQRAEGEVFAASARLAERLNLDPSLRLLPSSRVVVPITLINDQAPLPELLAVALRQRPEIAAGTARISEADARYREERWRPWLPTVWMGFSGGGFGGGSNLVPPLIGNFAGRTDFDVRTYWTVLNLGAGNRAWQKRRLAERGQAVAERQRSINLAREQVAAAQAGSIAARAQIQQRQIELQTAEQGFQEDLARTRAGEGRPIEVLNNLNRLVRARVAYITTLVNYNREQFRLFVALGSPPPVSTPEPPPPPPSAVTPLHAPFTAPVGH